MSNKVDKSKDENLNLPKLTITDILDTAYLSLILGVVIAGTYSYFTL